MRHQINVSASITRLKGGGVGERAKGAGLAALAGGVTGALGAVATGNWAGILPGAIGSGAKAFLVVPIVGAAPALKDGEDWATGKAYRHISDADAMQGFQTEALRLGNRRVGPSSLSISIGKTTIDAKWLAHRMPSWVGAASPEQSESAKTAAEELRNAYDRMPAGDREKWIEGVISGLNDAYPSGAPTPAHVDQTNATATGAKIAGAEVAARSGGAATTPSGESGSTLMDLIARINVIAKELNSDIRLLWGIRRDLDRIGREFDATLDGSHSGEEILVKFALAHDAVEQAHVSVRKAHTACVMYTVRLQSM